MDGYDIFERFCIMAESIGDSEALLKIRKTYGDKWVMWIRRYLERQEAFKEWEKKRKR
jgi:hypothetical protein